MNSFCEGLHKIFCLWIGLWPKQSDLLMVNAIFLHVHFDLLTGEWRTIVTSNDSWVEESLLCWGRVKDFNLWETRISIDDYKDKYSPVGNGPQKFTRTVCHGSGGRGDIWSGSGRFQAHWLGMRYISQLFVSHLHQFLGTTSSHAEVSLSLRALDGLHEPSGTALSLTKCCRHYDSTVTKNDVSFFVRC